MVRVIALALCATVIACTNSRASAQSSICTPVGGLTRLAGVVESSGVAAGRRTPGVLWTHNDSGTAELFAFDAKGVAQGRVLLTDVRITDWEDIAIGPCPGGSCVYAADIGDNETARRSVTIYRFPEPRPRDASVTVADRWQVAYPDRPHDAESLFVTPTAEVYLVTKERGDSAALYRVRPPQNNASAQLQRIAMIPFRLATGAATSADGTWTAVRSNEALLLYRTRELLSGKAEPAYRVDLTSIGEPQGEGVTFGSAGTIYLTGEGSGGGTLATLRCTLP